MSARRSRFMNRFGSTSRPGDGDMPKPNTLSLVAALILSASVLAADHEYAALRDEGPPIGDLQFLVFAKPPISMRPTDSISIRELTADTKVLLLSFFAPWCPNSNNEAPVLESLSHRYKKRGLNVVAIAEYAPSSDVRAFVAKYRWKFPILIESWQKDEQVRQSTHHYRLRTAAGDARKWGTPFNLIFTSGRERPYFVAGEMREKEITAFLEKAIPLPSPGK